LGEADPNVRMFFRCITTVELPRHIKPFVNNNRVFVIHKGLESPDPVIFCQAMNIHQFLYGAGDFGLLHKLRSYRLGAFDGTSLVRSHRRLSGGFALGPFNGKRPLPLCEAVFFKNRLRGGGRKTIDAYIPLRG